MLCDPEGILILQVRMNEALNKLNMPKDLAGNEECWKDVLGKTSRAMPTPKSLVRSSLHFQNILKSYEERGTPVRWEKY